VLPSTASKWKLQLRTERHGQGKPDGNPLAIEPQEEIPLENQELLNY
jgi:hypothetical protein